MCKIRCYHTPPVRSISGLYGAEGRFCSPHHTRNNVQDREVSPELRRLGALGRRIAYEDAHNDESVLIEKSTGVRRIHGLHWDSRLERLCVARVFIMIVSHSWISSPLRTASVSDVVRYLILYEDLVATQVTPDLDHRSVKGKKAR